MSRESDPFEGGGPVRRRRLFRPQVLPTLLTLGNLFCGFLAIAYAADALAVSGRDGYLWREYQLAKISGAGWMIFLGMVFDMLDGSVARFSGGTSALGAQLDSLADVVSFGVAPAMLAKCIAEGVGNMENRQITLYFSVFFALMAALRLARYNVQHGDPEEASLWFQGLPTPGAAAVIAGLAVVLSDRALRPDGAVLRALPFATMALGLLMVSRLPFAHVANRVLRGRKPVQYVVMALVVVMLTLAFHKELVLASAALLYALSGPAVAAARWFRRPAPAPAAAPRGDRTGARGEGP